MTQIVSLDSTTKRFALPLLYPGQIQKEQSVNEALIRLDTVAQPAFLDERAVPPASPVDGAIHLVAAGAQDGWTGHEGALAVRTGTTWLFVEPAHGMHALDLSSGQLVRYHDGEWKRAPTPAPVTGGGTVDQECRVALENLVDALKQFGIFSA